MPYPVNDYKRFFYQIVEFVSACARPLRDALDEGQGGIE